MRKTILTILINFILLYGFGQDNHIELYQEAIQNIKDKQCEEAVEKFGIIIKESENNELLKMTYIFNGQCLAKLGQLTQALESIEKAIEIDPQDISSYFDKIHILEDMNDHKQIISECNNLLEMDLDKVTQADCYYYLGKSYIVLNNPTKAIQNFDLGLKKNKTDYSMFFYRGYAYEADGKIDEAISDYSEAIELYPEFGQAFARRGILKIRKIIDEWEGTYVNVLGKDACSDLQKAKELGIDVKETMDIYCD